MKKKENLHKFSSVVKTSVVVFASLLFSSCVKDRPKAAVEEPVQTPAATKRVFILNEGNFGSGNSSVSEYNTDNDQLIDDYYKAQNSTLMGDVAQSMAKFNGKFYLVINNSSKILVCDSLMKKIAEMGGLNAPRYILPVSNDKAYVSVLFANGVHVLDLNTNSKKGSIPFSGWTEQMVLAHDKAFITNPGGNYTYVVNTLSDAVEDSVYVGPGGGSIVIDRTDNVWVLSAGDQKNSIPARLTKFSSTAIHASTSATLTNYWNGNLCVNRTKDTLYFLNTDVFRLSITDVTIHPTIFVAAGTKSFYGLGVNPNDFRVYVSDAIDYSQRSSIYVYDVLGNQKKTFKAGINSNSFYFE
ncbi:MAG: hypothetical protein PSX36_16355 [bacterium]|nr:hypothetical protein [bacterium]